MHNFILTMLQKSKRIVKLIPSTAHKGLMRSKQSKWLHLRKGKVLTFSLILMWLMPAAAQLIKNQQSNLMTETKEYRGNELVGSVFASSPVASDVKEAPSTDSITLTVKWTLVSNGAIEKDAHSSFTLINLKTAKSEEFATSVLNKYKTDCVMPIRVEKGKYALVFRFKTDMEYASSLTKLCAYDDVELSNDTTILFEGKNCTKAIRFRYLLPDGSSASVPVKINSKTTEYDKANLYRMYPNSFQVYKHQLADNGEINLAGTSYIVEYSYPGVTGSQRENSCDVYVNPDISANFVTVAYSMLVPINKSTPDYSTTDPTMLVAMESPLNVADTTFVMDASKYVEYKPIEPRHSQYEENTSSYLPGDLVADVRMACTGFSNGIIVASRVPGAPIQLYQQPGIKHAIMPKIAFYETKRIAGFGTAASGFGISLPKIRLQDDGAIRYICADNLGEGMMDILRAPRASSIYYMHEGHPFYSYTNREQTPDYGNSAAILSLASLTTVVNGFDYPIPNGMFWPINWVGNAGETRDIDRIPMSFYALANNDTIYTDYTTFTRGIATWSKEDHAGAIVKLVFDNKNFAIDSIVGHNHAEVTYRHATSDVCPPSLQMMQLRNAKTNKITTKFNKFEDVQLNLSGGDLNYEPSSASFIYAPATWKVEVAGLGSDNFVELPLTEMPEYFRMPVFGAFQRVNFEGAKLKSESGWFKLRISLTDANGNSSVQTVEPVFYVDEATLIKGIDSDDVCTLLSDNGLLRLSNGIEANFDVYAMDGSHVMQATASSLDISSLSKGVYIAKAVVNRKAITAKFIVR